MNNSNKFAETIIISEEGFSGHEYHCSEGWITIGFGRKLSEIKYAPLGNTKTTKEKEIVFVRKRIQEIEAAIQNKHPAAWMKCNDARKAILVSLGYQVGITGLFAFKKMWEALSRGDFELACGEMVDSKWFIQTRNRAKRHVDQMKIGSLHMYYLSQGAFV
jgi:lysozyme